MGLQNRNITLLNKTKMQDDNNIQNIKADGQNIVTNKELNIWEALTPVVALVSMLAYNIYVYGDDALSGSNQFILLIQ